jgi:hypothetical protein
MIALEVAQKWMEPILGFRVVLAHRLLPRFVAWLQHSRMPQRGALWRDAQSGHAAGAEALLHRRAHMVPVSAITLSCM